MNLIAHDPRTPKRPTRAFTVTEVLVAVGFTGFVLASALSGFSLAFGILQDARENLRAAQLLQEKVETIRLYSWDQINTPGFIPTTFTASGNPTNQAVGTLYHGTMLITNAPIAESYSTNLRQVVVELSWASGNTTRQRKVTTFVSRYGLQNYVY